MGRGSGPCAYCLEEKLVDVLGGDENSKRLSELLHDSIQEYKENYNCILDHINGELYSHEEE